MKWIALFFLLLVVAAPAASLSVAAWVPNLGGLAFFALGGVLAGLVLGSTRLRPYAAHGLGLAIGLEFALIQFARVAPAGEWADRVRALLLKLLLWVQAALQGGSSNDSLMFAFTLAVLCWAVGYFGTWFLLKARSPWWAVLPSGVVLLLNCSYDVTLLPFFYAYVAASMLLLLALDEWRRRERWEARRVPHQAVFRQVALGGVLLAAPLLALAWQVPAAHASQRLGDAWLGLPNPLLPFQTRFERLFSEVQARQGGVRALAFARSIGPRSAFELGDTPLLAVEAARGQYWRANTLDTYTGQQMASSDVSEQPAGPGLLVSRPPRYLARQELQQRITVLASQTSAVFAAGEPLRIGAEAVLEFRQEPSDFASLRFAAPLRKGDQYDVVSTVSTATVEQLRAAGGAYPTWVGRYLQLPTSVPQRVRDEAARVAGDAASPFEKAERTESYLRTFQYTTTDVPVPPSDRDWVDYMLFDARRGYCDYFATAMAVMLRSQGVPARVAQGFATGEWVEERGAYLVRESQAHSWVEVFFPEYGWVVFEPSAARPLPTRPHGDLTTPPGLPSLGSQAGQSPPIEQQDGDALRAMRSRGELPDSEPLGVADLAGKAAKILLLGLAGLVASAVVLGGVGYLLWTRGLRGLAWYQRFYAQTVRLSTWCGLDLSATQTPFEQAERVSQRVPSAGPLAATIADSYVAGTYGRGADAAQRSASDEAWRQLRVLLPRTTARARLHVILMAPLGRVVRRLRRAAGLP